MSARDCPTEQALAVHADGELPAADAQAVASHLARCPGCAALLEALRGESRLLARVLDEAPAPQPARRAVAADLLATGAVLLAAAAGLRAAFGWVQDVGAQSPVDLETRSFVVSLLFETLFYVVREGASMLTPLVSALGLVGLVALFALFARGARRSAAFVVPFLGLLALPGPADALERRVARSSHEEVLLRADETLDDSLLAVGETVAIDGTVTGNLIACAQRVIVRGRVMGDLVVAGQRIDLAGTVDGNVAGFGQILVVRGPVGKSLHTFGEHVTLDREGRVDGDVVSFAGGLDLEGRMGRDLLAFGGFVNLRGEVLRHVTSWTERLRVDAPAKVGGDLVAHTADAAKVSIDPGAAISGKTETKVETKHHKSRYARPSFYVWKLIWLAAAFLAGLLVHRFFPVLLATTPSGLALGRALGFGFVALVAAPVALVVLGLTMVGLPLALAGFAVWLFALYLSSIVVGALVGHALLGRAEGRAASFPAALLVGLVTVTVAAHLPFVGFLLGLFVTVLGLGITVLQARRGLRAQAA